VPPVPAPAIAEPKQWRSLQRWIGRRQYRVEVALAARIRLRPGERSQVVLGEPGHRRGFNARMAPRHKPQSESWDIACLPTFGLRTML